MHPKKLIGLKVKNVYDVPSEVLSLLEIILFKAENTAWTETVV